MDKCVSKLTVCFEKPFWVGIYERECAGRYEVCKITFGAEPKDYEVYDFLLKHWSQLTFGSSMQGVGCADRKINPKRIQRNIRKELQQGIGTKAQQALKMQQAQRKQERKATAKEKREQDALRRFALRQEKRKTRHRDRG